MLSTRKNLLALGLAIAGLIVAIDQFTKHLTTEYLSYNALKPVFPGFDLTLRHNTGAAFNFLADEAGWQRWFFVLLALLISICILVWLRKLNTKQKLEGIGLALILGGALGNLIDRLMFGYVVDFILLYYKEWQWPAFNVADSAITVGVVFFMIGLFQKDQIASPQT